MHGILLLTLLYNSSAKRQSYGSATMTIITLQARSDTPGNIDNQVTNEKITEKFVETTTEDCYNNIIEKNEKPKKEIKKELKKENPKEKKIEKKVEKKNDKILDKNSKTKINNSLTNNQKNKNDENGKKNKVVSNSSTIINGTQSVVGKTTGTKSTSGQIGTGSAIAGEDYSAAIEEIQIRIIRVWAPPEELIGRKDLFIEIELIIDNGVIVYKRVIGETSQEQKLLVSSIMRALNDPRILPLPIKAKKRIILKFSPVNLQ